MGEESKEKSKSKDDVTGLQSRVSQTKILPKHGAVLKEAKTTEKTR